MSVPVRRWQIARWVLGLLLVLPCLGAVQAAESGPADGERARIEAERRSVEARYAQAQASCQGRFLLTPCLDDARSERRVALDRLQRRQLEIDDLARRERVAQRLQALQQRSPGSAVAPTLQVSPALQDAAPLASASARHRAVLPAPADAAAASAAAQRKQADFLQRQRQAQAHRDAVLRRNADQDVRRPPAAGLPVPPASR